MQFPFLSILNFFKRYALIGILFIVSCQQRVRRVIPDFQANSSVWKLPAQASEFARNMDFTIGYQPGGIWTEPPFKTRLIGFKDGIWEKVEIQTWRTEPDSINSKLQIFEFVHMDVVIRKEWRVLEATSFLKQLKEKNFFTLKTDEELITESVKMCDRRPREIKDGNNITLWITENNKVRLLHFDYPWYRLEECPGVVGWKNVLDIKKLFEEEKWFINEH